MMAMVDKLIKQKASAFNWVFTALISVVIFTVKDMHDDLKFLMKSMPAMQVELEYLKDRRLTDKLQLYDPPVYKHEESITYDSLKKK